MYNVKINNEIDLTYPDGFKEMSEQELTKYFGKPDDRWGVFDAPNHIVLSVSWKKAGFFGFMTDAESYLIDLESHLHRRLLNYQRLGSYKTKIEPKKKAVGIRFEYRVNDAVTIQVCDLFTFKHKKNFYTIYYITRQQNAIESRPAFEAVLKSIKVG